MRLHSVVRVASVILSALVFTSGLAAQDKAAEAKYKFKKGDIIRYEVTSALEATQVGTHSAFLQNGNERPLSWTVNGTFENVVIDVNEADGAATLERRVKSIQSSGHVNDERFKFSWDRDKDKTAPDESKVQSLMDRFAISMINQPTRYGIDVEGRTSPQFPELGRLVMRRGMMFWPVRPNEMSWVTSEEIALPVLHDKIKLEFKNTVTQDATRTGYKARIITAPVALKSHAKTEGFGFEGLTFTVTGQAKVEFDMTNGRLQKLELDLKITFAGKGQVPEGGEGDIKGIATYKETQVYKD